MEYRSPVQYFPFYGGAKGLEVKTDDKGAVISEKIVSEDKISNDNVINKNTNENLLAKVLAANLQKLQTISSSLQKLHNLGHKVGFLAESDKGRFKSQLASLEQTASDSIKLIEEIGDNVDILFKNKNKKRQYNDEEDVGEEGVGIDSANDGEVGVLTGTSIAEANPVGLAVIGENGLAASRPVATAVSLTGVALARPIATAIAGIDPTLLGINFQHHQNKN